jgi:predicted enzyme related to lactoylglutathione lyase
MGNPVVFFEIAGPDGQRLRDFYGAAFGWTFDTARVPGYGYAVGAGLNGGIRQDPPDKVLYIQVPDLAAALELVAAAGGQTVLPPTEVPGVIAFALFKDPAGNLLGLVRG